MIFDGLTFYMRSALFEQFLPAGKRWLKIDLDADRQAGRLRHRRAHVTRAAARIRPRCSPTSRRPAATSRGSARETVRGVATTHYKVTIDFRKVPDSAPADQRAAVRRSIEQLIELSGASTAPIEVWIGKDGLARRIVTTSTTGTEAQRIKLRQRVELYDFGTKVDVAIPPASAVIDFGDLGGFSPGRRRRQPLRLTLARRCETRPQAPVSGRHRPRFVAASRDRVRRRAASRPRRGGCCRLSWPCWRRCSRGRARARAQRRQAQPRARPAPGTTSPAGPPATRNGAAPAISPRRFRALTLDRDPLAGVLATAPRARTAAARTTPLTISLPAPGGGMERFAIEASPVMEPALAAQHPEIATYRGTRHRRAAARRWRSTSPRRACTPRSAVRAAAGTSIPTTTATRSVYVSYRGRDVDEDPHGGFVERSPLAPRASAPGRPETAAAPGDLVPIRNYRLALASDPTYATYHGAANVTAAKVTLVNRVNQIYEDDLAIKLNLVAGNDILNFNTTALMTGAGGPCGVSPCYSPSEVDDCDEDTIDRQRRGPQPAHRGRQLRHRPHRDGHVGRDRLRRRRRRRTQGRRLHRRHPTRRRPLRGRLRGARDGPPVQRRPHVQRRQRATAEATSAGRRRSSRAAAARSWPTPASAAPTICSRTATRTSRSSASTRSTPTSPAPRATAAPRWRPPTTRPSSPRRPASRSRRARRSALTGAGSDADGNPLTYLWEQDDAGSGTSLFSNTKPSGPLFRVFGTAANVSAANAILSPSPGQNAAGTDPTRVFPDLAQIAANTTNAATGQCPASNVTCFSEFLPTSGYADALHFRLTARDGRRRRLARRHHAHAGQVRRPVPDHLATGRQRRRGHAHPADLERRGHERGAGRRRERPDHAVDRRRPDVPEGRAEVDAQRRRADGAAPGSERQHQPPAHRADRQRLLRHQRRELHDRPGRPGGLQRRARRRRRRRSTPTRSPTRSRRRRPT